MNCKIKVNIVQTSLPVGRRIQGENGWKVDIAKEDVEGEEGKSYQVLAGRDDEIIQDKIRVWYGIIIWVSYIVTHYLDTSNVLGIGSKSSINSWYQLWSLPGRAPILRCNQRHRQNPLSQYYLLQIHSHHDDLLICFPFWAPKSKFKTLPLQQSSLSILDMFWQAIWHHAASDFQASAHICYTNKVKFVKII